MRVNYVLLAAAVVLVGAIDASVATADTVAKLGVESPAFAVESDYHRSLRLVKDDVIDSEEDESDDDKEEEERGFMDQVHLTKLAAQFYGKSSDEIGQIIKNLDDDKLKLIFDKGEYLISKHLPGFETGMDGAQFGRLISHLPMEEQAPLLSAYSKYLSAKGLLD